MNASLPLSKEPSSAQPRPALRLVKTNGLSRDDWLDVRHQGIGSSGAAAAVGLNPYKSPLELWAEKTGSATFPQPDPQDDRSPMYWGALLEPVVAAHYTRRTGHRVRRVNAVLQHPKHAWMLANLDREIIGAPDVQILECKTAGIYGARLWKDGVPEYVQLQVMHQLAVTGKQAADVAVLIGGQELQVHRIERNETLIGQLIELEAQFWACVEERKEPSPDGSESAQRALQALYPHDNGETLDWTQDIEMGSAFSDLQAIRQRIKTFELEEARLRQRIEQRMGTAGRVLFDTGEITYRKSKDSTVLDTKRLLLEHPELEKAYSLTRSGSRRFVVRGQGVEDNSN
jgi:putative phage-type endonuclease